MIHTGARNDAGIRAAVIFEELATKSRTYSPGSAWKVCTDAILAACAEEHRAALTEFSELMVAEQRKQWNWDNIYGVGCAFASSMAIKFRDKDEI